jgi:predicted nucleotide-binding protein
MLNMLNEGSKKRKPKATQAYPKNSLMDSLKVAQAIKDDNAGKPFNRLTLAKSLNYSPSSYSFRMLITSSSKFGLTTGSYAAEKIELTELGTSIVMPRNESERKVSITKALFSIPFYEKLFKSFNNNKLPAKDLLINTLHREYEIPMEDTGNCYELILKNAKELNLLDEAKNGSMYVKLDNLENEAENIHNDAEQQVIEKENEDIHEGESEEDDTPSVEISNTRNLKVFIAHGNNKPILEQIKVMLQLGEFEPIVAEEHETTAKPVSQKVLDQMRECSAAVISVTADPGHGNEDDGYSVNQNVLIEIGAAFVLYNEKVILVWDKRVKVPSNLQGLYRCEYEGNELSWTAGMQLQKALLSIKRGEKPN